MLRVASYFPTAYVRVASQTYVLQHIYDDDHDVCGVQVFKRLIYEWDNDPRASRIVTQIQEYVGCCGARRN